jgi:hypothetical protein
MKLFPKAISGRHHSEQHRHPRRPIRAFEAFTGKPNYDPCAAFINSYVWSPLANTWFISNNLEYTAPELNQPYFANFTAFPASYSDLRLTILTSLTSRSAYRPHQGDAISSHLRPSPTAQR